MSIAKWIDEHQTPYLTMTDRMIVVLYSLGITDKTQIQTVTGWTEGQINEALKNIRLKVKTPNWLKEDKRRLKKAKNGELELSEMEISRLKERIEKEQARLEKERNKWLESWRPRPTKPYVYALGIRGVEHACYIRQEYANKYKKPPRAQVGHYMGINAILCRLIEAEADIDNWLSTKEVQQELYFTLKRLREADPKRKKEKTGAPPAKPDALIKINGQRYFLEYDAGTETSARLMERFHNYLDLFEELGEDHPPVVWVTVSEKQKALIEEVAAKVRDFYDEVQTPTMYIFLEGEETDFLMGKTEAKPFWEAD